MNNFWTRTLAGSVFVILVTGSILWHPMVFSFLFLVITLLGIRELVLLLARTEQQPTLWMAFLSGTYLYISLSLYAHNILGKWALPLLLANMAIVATFFIVQLFRHKPSPFSQVAHTLLAPLYVALPLGLLNFFYYPGLQSNVPDPTLLLGVFLLVWINDTFAYLFGRSLGRHFLFPRISPKKTWEGSAGGAVTTLLAAWLFSTYSPVLSLPGWIGFATIAVVFGTLGDLTESMLKRSSHVKDSGSLIPGHGGVLDRFDAVLLVAPFSFCYLSFIWYL